jgi:cobyrinic acid a,c-diamide synthase
MIAEESPVASENMGRLAETILQHVDVDQLVAVSLLDDRKIDAPTVLKKEGPRNSFTVAIAYDKAFSFYYEDNLDLLREAGGKIITFSPLKDGLLPSGTDIIYIGGGYPELHAQTLSENTALLRSLKEWAHAEKPMYAECGGLMFLSKGLHDDKGGFYPLAGVFPFETRMLKKPRLGYREVVLREDCVVGERDRVCRGHEFHYSEIAEPAIGSVYQVSDSKGKSLGFEGFRSGNTLASYVHLHFGSNNQICGQFAMYGQRKRIS